MRLDKNNGNDNIHYMYPATITSQWQMSIPAPVRDFLKGKKKVVVYREKDGLKIKPVKDFLELAGTFKTTKKATSRQVREAFEKYLGRMAAGRP